MIVTALELKQFSPKFSVGTLLTLLVVNSEIIVNILNVMTAYTLLLIVYDTLSNTTRGNKVIVRFIIHALYSQALHFMYALVLN